MNTLKRLVFGILSSLLLAVGFAQAADRLDPMTQTLHRAIGSVRDDGESKTPEDQQPPVDQACIGTDQT